MGEIMANCRQEHPRRSSDLDPRDPHKWSKGKKLFVVFIILYAVFNSAVSSALPSGNAAVLSSSLDINNGNQVVLLTSVFLLGYVFGPLAFGPLSEIYGRKSILLPIFLCFTAFTLGCALSPNWASLVVFRLLTGITASAPITVVGGVYSDIYGGAQTRGRAMASFMTVNTFGPILGPLLSGFPGELGWRWPFWIALMLAGAGCVLLCLLPETYAPVIRKGTGEKNEKTDDKNATIKLSTSDRDIKATIRGTLVRPVRMFFYEPIVFCICVYLAFGFGLFYLFFEAYPIIFQGIYKMKPGIASLAFIPIGVGAILPCGIFFYYDNIIIRAQKKNKNWSRSVENCRLPLACIGGPTMGLSLFWLAWTANPRIHPILPILAGLPFGIGWLLLFMALTNYLTDLYASQAASAMAATMCTRSICGFALPFAAGSMYKTLGVQWAGTLLGFLSLALGLIPWVSLKWGRRLRERSKGVEWRDTRGGPEPIVGIF